MPLNARYYQFGPYGGLGNFTSVVGVPVFVSKVRGVARAVVASTPARSVLVDESARPPKL